MPRLLNPEPIEDESLDKSHRNEVSGKQKIRNARRLSDCNRCLADDHVSDSLRLIPAVAFMEKPASLPPLAATVSHKGQRGAKSAKECLERGVDTEKLAAISKNIAKFGAARTKKYVLRH